MAPTDRPYCAKCAHHGADNHDPDCPERVTLPDPADWQKVVEAVKRGRDAGAPDIAVCIVAGEAAIAAVRNMEARSDG